MGHREKVPIFFTLKKKGQLPIFLKKFLGAHLPHWSNKDARRALLNFRFSQLSCKIDFLKENVNYFLCYDTLVRSWVGEHFFLNLSMYASLQIFGSKFYNFLCG